MRIKATLVKARELLPGDLFSTVGPSYWDRFAERGSIGECVYIRTNEDAVADADAAIFRIEVER